MLTLQLGVCCTGTCISSILVTSKGLWWRCILKWAHLLGISQSHKTRSFRSAVSGDRYSFFFNRSYNPWWVLACLETDIIFVKWAQPRFYGRRIPNGWEVWMIDTITYVLNRIMWLLNESFSTAFDIQIIWYIFFFWCAHRPYSFYHKASLAVVHKHNCKVLCLCWVLVAFVF